MADYAIHDTTLYDIADVIRKKDGTSALIDPADYADRINLMGMLEEKTVSGSVVAFSDGADDVPLKSCAVTIAPTLDGVSSVDVVNTGVNIWNEQWEVGGLNTSTGADSTQTDRIRSVGFVRVQPSEQYYFYNGTDIASQSNINIVVCCYDYNKQYTGSYYYKNKTQPTFSNPANSYYIRFYCVAGYGTTYNNDISINYPATDTDYHAYNGTTHSANLGRTIYGGEVDVVNGTGTDSFTRWQLKDRTWIREETAGGFFVFVTTTISNKALNYNFECEGYTNAQTYRTNLQDKQIGTYNGTNGRNRFAIRDDTYTTVEAFIEAQGDNYVVYENNAPETFTFDPISINSRLGDNSIWADTGDISDCTYRGQGTVTVYSNAEDSSF